MNRADVATCSGFKFSQLEMSKRNVLSRGSGSQESDHLTVFPEVVLSQIIPVFRFAPSKAEIVWKFGGVTSPSVKGSVMSFLGSRTHTYTVHHQQVYNLLLRFYPLFRLPQVKK